MNRSRLILSGSVFLVFSIVLSAASTPAQNVDGVALDRLVNDAVKFWQTPGAAVAVVRGDEVVYLKGFGVRDVKTKEPVDPDTIFAIGSTTKAFTTAAMAMLADDGKLDWDDPVRKHLPWFHLADPLADESVTLRDLVTHRSGLSRHDMLWYNSPWDRHEIIRRIGLVPLNRPFRSTFQYQNIMFLTAGQIVGELDNSSYEDFVQRRIFDPLGMKTANFTTTMAEKSPNHASPHARKMSKIEAIPWRNIDNVGPAGSINASVRDLSSWIRLHLNDGIFNGKRLISFGNMREMHLPQMVIRLEGRWKLFFPEDVTSQLSYGLGWFITDYRGHKLVMHGGTIDGFRASIILVPRARIGVAVLSNLSQTQMPEATCYLILDQLLGLEPRDWNTSIRDEVKKYEGEQTREIAARLAKRKKDTRPSREPAAYAGGYFNPAYGKAQIILDQSHLILEWSNFKAPLDHFHFDTFNIKDQRLAAEQLLFHLGADGDVSSMDFLGMKFEKMKPNH